MCVYVHVYVCAYVCMGKHVNVCEYVLRTEVSIKYLIDFHLIFFTMLRSLIETGVHFLGLCVWKSLRIILSLPP